MSSYRHQAAANSSYNTDFASPTDSEFSVGYDEPDYVRNWDYQRVAEWLRSINAGQYIELFRRNDITGANLIDLDSSLLKDMGIKKIGDRVRIGAQAKKFRYNEYQRKRESGRADRPTMTPPSAGSPRGAKGALRHEKSDSRLGVAPQINSLRGGSRPASPLHTFEGDRGTSRMVAFSPRENAAREQAGAYFPDPNTRSNHSRKTTSLMVDTDAANGIPRDKPWIRAIFDSALAAIVTIEGCKTVEDIILRTLRKGQLKESHHKSYCFWVLDGTEPNPAYCRRLSGNDVVRICNDPTRAERQRLIFRKIHAGEPEGNQLESAAAWAIHQQQQGPTSATHTPSRSQNKLQRPVGEALPPLSYPMSPASAAERERHLQDAAEGLESGQGTIRPRTRKAQELHGARPDSSLVVADPKQFFPDVDEHKIESLRRMSIRRSQRLSRATSRLSVASNVSFSSSIEDAPPVPRIPDSAWHNQRGLAPRARPLSVYRESLSLGPLDEESPIEPDRKSYISLADGGEDSEAEEESPTVNITDADGNTIRKSYFSDGSSFTEGDNSLNEQLSQVIEADGEEEDEALNMFLKPDAWENIPYMRGKLIGQGSFGSVYLALHATTAELMAVKQVELPSTEGTAVDAKKNNMVEALKHEIGLLRDMKHKHIVQYLGSSSDANNLNIFLEYVPGGSIAKMLVDYGSLNEVVISKYVAQTLVGLAFLHSKDIIHRDIKGANILIDTKGVVKISDFGISKRVQDSKTLLSETGPGGARRGRGLAANRVSLQGSVFWMAPEVVKQTAYTRKADIWSLGCLMVEMLTGSHPHPDLSQLQAIFKIGGKGADPAPKVPDGAGREIRDFLGQTFFIDHEQRPEAQQLLETAFVKGKEV